MTRKWLSPFVVGGLLAGALICGCDQHYDQFDPERAASKQFANESKLTQALAGHPIDDVIAKFGQPISKLPAPDDNRQTMYVFENTENLSGTPDGDVVIRRVFWVDLSLHVCKVSMARREVDSGPAPLVDIPH